MIAFSVNLDKVFTKVASITLSVGLLDKFVIKKKINQNENKCEF